MNSKLQKSQLKILPTTDSERLNSFYTLNQKYAKLGKYHFIRIVEKIYFSPTVMHFSFYFK